MKIVSREKRSGYVVCSELFPWNLNITQAEENCKYCTAMDVHTPLLSDDIVLKIQNLESDRMTSFLLRLRGPACEIR